MARTGLRTAAGGLAATLLTLATAVAPARRSRRNRTGLRPRVAVPALVRDGLDSASCGLVSNWTSFVPKGNGRGFMGLSKARCVDAL